MATDYTSLFQYAAQLAWAYGIQLARIAGLVVMGYYGTAWVHGKVHDYLKRLYPEELRSLVIARIIAYAFLFLVAMTVLHEFGVNVTALLGTAGIIGVAMAYALQTSVSNVMSGLFLTVERPFEIGDILIINGSEGTVEKANLFAVILRTHGGTLIRVPHEQLLKQVFVNVTGLSMRRHDVDIKIAADEDVNRVIVIIKNIIRENPWCSKDSSTAVLKEITGTYCAIAIGLWVDQKHMPTVQKSFLLELKKAFDTHKVRMAKCISGRCHDDQ